MKEQKLYKVYTHTTPDGMVYVGFTGMDIDKRWKHYLYKENSLHPYIEKWGWENIRHEVIYTCYNRKEALQVEDEMICYYREKGICINKVRSGLIWSSDKSVYRKNQYYKHRDKQLEYHKKYNKVHKNEISIKGKIKRSTPEGKIYDRVHAYNRYHPDKITITPMEAKNNYLQFGIIPDFIKKDDLVA